MKLTEVGLRIDYSRCQAWKLLCLQRSKSLPNGGLFFWLFNSKHHTMKDLFRKDGKTLKLPYQARNASVSARVSEETKELLRTEAYKYGLSISELVYRLIMRGIPERLH